MGVKSKIKKWISTKIVNLLAETKEQAPFIIKKSHNIRVGKENYHNGNLIVKGKGVLHIGSYCAFGQDIKIILSNHNYEFPSIQYTLYMKNFGGLPYEITSGSTEIGSDVWIGDNVVLLPNVKIGNGVIVGAGAVVTKDIPDYAIVGGSPAKILKYRFSESKIKDLNDKKWWDWTDEEIGKNKDFFFKK